jgi:hypothetical protein
MGKDLGGVFFPAPGLEVNIRDDFRFSGNRRNVFSTNAPILPKIGKNTIPDRVHARQVRWGNRSKKSVKGAGR